MFGPPLEYELPVKSIIQQIVYGSKRGALVDAIMKQPLIISLCEGQLKEASQGENGACNCY